MTPSNSREVSLSLSRDRLARALSRLDRLSRDAAERINELVRERQLLEAQVAELQKLRADDHVAFDEHVQKVEEAAATERHELENRLQDLTRMYEQERSNFEQRAILLQSIASEAEERAFSIEQLRTRQQELETIIEEQRLTISGLNQDVQNTSLSVNDRDDQLSNLRSRVDELEAALAAREKRIENVTAEREQMKAMLYEKERDDAQWAIKLSPDERETATHAIDTLIAQLSDIEARIAGKVTVPEEA